MVLESLQAQTLIIWFNNLKINQLGQMAAVNDLLRPFEDNINLGDPTGIKLYLRATKEIDKEIDKLDIPISNAKYIAYFFLSLSKIYSRVRLAFMVEADTDTNNMFIVVEKIHIEDI